MNFLTLTRGTKADILFSAILSDRHAQQPKSIYL